MREDDVAAADQVLCLAFGTIRGLPDPSTAFGDAELVRTRFRAAPECAWVAERGGDVVGSVLAARWGSLGFLGPLSVRPDLWDRGIGGRLLDPCSRRSGPGACAGRAVHVRLQRQASRPLPEARLVAGAPDGDPGEGRRSGGAAPARARLGGTGPARGFLDEARDLTHAVLAGLDVGREILAVCEQEIGDTVLVRDDGGLGGFAVCHRGAGSEAGSDTCYVKFAAARPGEGAPARFERLLDACEAFVAGSGSSRLVAGVNTGRLDAYRRLLARGFRAQRIGLSMRLFPDAPHFETPTHYVVDDLR